ncbi:MAG: hypothetical protein CMI95_04540 [Pelagibacteraceae bacterium]|nr:hypothetical protein [Pelagibacteraceae bacterium]PPR51471.1 MAG: Bifunctional NAD(P)H-hydrate repair enzyme Nnr [Alphaproteobacteria bacterium MarineAlpha5_Bin10]
MKNSIIYTNNLIKKAERKTFEKTESFKVMKQAARLCFDYINKNYPNKKIIVFCGPGNNGGDGVLIAKYLLKEKFLVKVHYPFGEPKTKDSKRALSLLKEKNIIVKYVDFKKYNIIIDALFGTGYKKKFNRQSLYFFKKINDTNKEVISIDMPSGVDTDSGSINKIAIKANKTLTFHRYKIGQWLLPGKKYCGKIIILNIGLKNLDRESKIKLNFPPKITIPNIDDHKFRRGTCLLIAGEKLVGAAKLSFLSASQAILRAGAGVCKIIVHESQVDIFKPHILEEMIIAYRTIKDLKKTILNEKSNSIIFGCGIENNRSNKEILKFLLKLEVNLVLDATVFSIIQKNKKIFISSIRLRKSSTIFTPHEGEFKRLFNVTDNKINDCQIASKTTKSIIVYKGNDTVIGSFDGEIYINYLSSPFLATSGSGDVLAGLIGSFVAQKIDSLSAAKLGCFIHSQCAINLGPGLIASDLVRQIPIVIKKLISN